MKLDVKQEELVAEVSREVPASLRALSSAPTDCRAQMIDAAEKCSRELKQLPLDKFGIEENNVVRKVLAMLHMLKQRQCLIDKLFDVTIEVRRREVLADGLDGLKGEKDKLFLDISQITSLLHSQVDSGTVALLPDFSGRVSPSGGRHDLCTSQLPF